MAEQFFKQGEHQPHPTHPSKMTLFFITSPFLILALEASFRLNLLINIYPSGIPKENTLFIWTLFVKERKLSTYSL